MPRPPQARFPERPGWSARRGSHTLRATLSGTGRRALRLSAVVLPLVLAFTRPCRAQEPLPQADVRELKTAVRADGLWVSYRLEGVFSPTVQERLAGSAPVRFVHRIRLVRRRLFTSRILVERTIETIAEYDNLTRQYSLTRIVDGVESEKTSTESEEDMRRFMTQIREFRLAGPDAWAGEKKATLQVRAEYEDTWLLFLLPWSYAARRERDIPLTP